MEAPVDIVIRFLKQKADEAHEKRLVFQASDQAWYYHSGKVDACKRNDRSPGRYKEIIQLEKEQNKL